jgi:hypothetical protein
VIFHDERITNPFVGRSSCTRRDSRQHLLLRPNELACLHTAPQLRVIYVTDYYDSSPWGKVMFHRIRNYPLIATTTGRSYRPRAYGSLQPDGTWDGWIVFFPLGGGSAIASDRETTQSSFEALTVWAAGLTPVYVEGAFLRALELAQPPSVLTQLAVAEYDALEDAERLETAAEIERAAAELDVTAAADARHNADQTRRDRLATESAPAATEATVATTAAEIQGEAAREARAVAADAARRSQEAKAATTHTKRPKARDAKKK